MTRIVGLSGGIGTGKSTVAELLGRLGAVVIDADAIVVHRVDVTEQLLVCRYEKVVESDFDGVAYGRVN